MFMLKPLRRIFCSNECFLHDRSTWHGVITALCQNKRLESFPHNEKNTPECVFCSESFWRMTPALIRERQLTVNIRGNTLLDLCKNSHQIHVIIILAWNIQRFSTTLFHTQWNDVWFFNYDLHKKTDCPAQETQDDLPKQSLMFPDIRPKGHQTNKPPLSLLD